MAFLISKLGSKDKRPLGIPTVRDRVVQTALRNVIEPIFEKKFTDESYGFRPKRSAKDALRQVQQLLNEGCSWVVDADIQPIMDDMKSWEAEQGTPQGAVISPLLANIYLHPVDACAVFCVSGVVDEDVSEVKTITAGQTLTFKSWVYSP